MGCPDRGHPIFHSITAKRSVAAGTFGTRTVFTDADSYLTACHFLSVESLDCSLGGLIIRHFNETETA